jgi:hypothetical protein
LLCLLDLLKFTNDLSSLFGVFLSELLQFFNTLLYLDLLLEVFINEFSY